MKLEQISVNLKRRGENDQPNATQEIALSELVSDSLRETWPTTTLLEIEKDSTS